MLFLLLLQISHAVTELLGDSNLPMKLELYPNRETGENNSDMEV